MDTNVIDAAELDLVRSSLRHALGAADPASVIDSLLAEGWAELCDAAPAQAITALAEQAGAARSAAPVADLAVLWGAGIAPDPTTAVLHGGLALAGAARAERFVTVTADGVAAVPASGVMLAPVRGLDPNLGLAHATVDASANEVLGGPANAVAAIAAGRRALASQMVGASEQMLADTLAYVQERHQYGRAQQVASTHCYQVHGGIAFTVEHGFQQWVRRGLVLDRLLGGHEELTRAVGAHLVATGRVPRVPQLF